MRLGRMTFDTRLSLDVTSMSMRKGTMNIEARGPVTAILDGVVPYAIYGSDESLIGVGKCDWDAVMADLDEPPRKGDTLVTTIHFELNLTGVMCPTTTA